MDEGPFCQSCGMPMEKSDDFGTDKNGDKNSDYCNFCYQKGKFTEPNVTMEQMIDKVAKIVSKQMDAPEAETREIVKIFLPKLKRWKK